MIKLTATALIHYISPVLQVSDKFQKRELILNDSWEKDGKSYPNFVLIEFTGDKMSLLDNFAPGQRVSVEAYVNGREYQGRYFNSIKGMGISLYQPQQTYPSTVGQQYAPPAPGFPQQQAYPQAPGSVAQGGYPPSGYYPQQQPAYPQQSPYPQQGGYTYTQAQAPAPMPGTPQGGNLGPEGLPFNH